jgi:hypothetical protein
MPINLRRMSRMRPASNPPAPEISPRLQRAVHQMVRAEQSRVLPSDRDLDALAEVRPADIDRAESLWDAAQIRAGTGLDGLLSAKAGE